MMSNSIYSKVIVMGIGTVASQCANIVKSVFNDVTFIETRSDSVMTQEAFCNKKHIAYLNLSANKSLVTNYLNGLSEKTLVVSVSNRYIFPEDIISKPNLTIINYHGSLLPKYPGRNAEAWAIYNNEAEGGITWHTVSTGIDAGDILVQIRVPISDKTTSFSLLREYGRAAQSSFAEILAELLEGSIRTTPQYGEKSCLYLAKMRPNDSKIDQNWNGKQISCFLRAMDYGPLETMGKPIYKGKSIVKYKIVEEDNPQEKTEENDNMVVIRKYNQTINLTLE